jgi:hypothetical protein
VIKYHLEILNVLSTCIILCMRYYIYPTHKQALLFYSTIFRIWKSLNFRAKPFQKLSSSKKFCWKRFFYDEFLPLSSSMSTWQNTMPCQIWFYLKWQKIFQKYLVHIIKDFLKSYIMFTCSYCSPTHSRSHAHKIMSLVENHPR